MTHATLNPSMLPVFLFIVLLFALYVLFMMYRKKLGIGNPTKQLQILDKINLDRKTGLFLIRAGSETVLIGVTPNGMSTLADVSNSHEFLSFNKELKEKIIEFPNTEDKYRA